MDSQVLPSLERLEQWIERNGWAGYDPYDLRELSLYRFLEQRRWGRRVVHRINRYAPVVARRVLGVQPQTNAKAIGLLALGYLARFEATHDQTYKEKALACLQWLIANAQPGYSGACWGYPFDWHTRIEIPAGTPSGVVSAICGWAFLEAYRILQDQYFLDVAHSTAEFQLHDLNLDRLDDQRVCFSYTPLDHFHIHNANLFVASHLLDVGSLTGERAYIKTAELAVAYTLGEQNADGSWYYWGPQDKMLYRVDHYHTGFVLRCLDRICIRTKKKDWLTALKRGFQFYVNHLFGPSGLPKLTSEKSYPVDIHSCSEAILCLTQLSPRNPMAATRLAETLKWTLDEMQSQDGYFFYRKFPQYTSDIAYMRWGQTWMLWALAAYVGADNNGAP